MSSRYLPRRSIPALVMGAIILSACQDDGVAAGSGSGVADGRDLPDSGGFDGSSQDPGGPTSGDGGPATNDVCEPPDMLLVLDRTLSMARTPAGTRAANTAEGHRTTKWFLAIDAVEKLTAELEGTIRFGLELFPEDPGGDKCVTLTQLLAGRNATNDGCMAGEVVVAPQAQTAEEIAGVLDPETTLMCISTPIGPGLDTARAALSRIANAGREQYAVLLTDGRNTCQPNSGPLSSAQALMADGVKLFVIGFDGSGRGIDNGQLNDLACAGHTAKGFPDTCVEDASGNFTAKNRDGDPLYSLATNPSELLEELKTVAGQVCCNCLL